MLSGHCINRPALICLITFFLLGCAACHQGVIPDLVFIQEEVEELPLALPKDHHHPVYRGLQNREIVTAFYERTGQRPVWVDRDRTNALGDSLIAFLQTVRYFGLLPRNYHAQELTSANKLWWRPEVRLRREVLLSDAFLSLASDLRVGRLSGRKPDSLTVELLLQVLSGGGLSRILVAQQPGFVQYHALRNALVEMIDNADPVTRRALLAGTTTDSLLIHRRIKTIEINLERWRQEKKPWTSRYIYVNIPSFMLTLIEDNKVVLETRSIVGKPERATPEFSSTVQCFVTYPYWHVPRRISVEEFLPFIQRDTSFISRNNFDVLDRKGNILHRDSIPWKSFHKNNFPVVLRQREGTENSLGILKFMFDNPYAVFVHDTNAPRLFNVKKRALSHGCIRIERAADLAHHLVTGQPGEKSPLLNTYLNEKLRHTVELTRPIRIHIRYFTAAADRNGKVVFFDDIYQKDLELVRKLYQLEAVDKVAIDNMQ